MNDVHLISCVGVDVEDLAMLRHFLAHYRGLGVAPERMRVVLNTADAGSPNLAAAEAILREAGAAPAEVWIAPYTSGGMWEKRREVQRRVAGRDDWVVNADVDELHEYPEALGPFLAWCAGKGVTAVQGPFIDRLAADMTLARVRADAPLERQFPVEADVQCAVGGVGAHHDLFGTVKLMVHRGAVEPAIGGHHPVDDAAARHLYGKGLGRFRSIGAPGFRFALPTKVHHYKWTATLLDGLRRRVDIPGASAADIEYSRKLIAYFEGAGGVRPGDAVVRRSRAMDRAPWRLRVSALRKGAFLRGRLRALGRRAAP